jgi:site-specific DNA-methyltransferase (adenine-specific)
MQKTSSGIEHGVICSDCRDLAAVRRLLDGRKVNVIVTSPPYASQRAYDEASGFKPIAPDEYVSWYKDVASVLWDVLADDGSYFLNIKEHADQGERNLYVKDLVLAHKRQWGWRFVDEFCWRKTSDGVPGGWGNRFKNAWEPVFHFSKSSTIKFRPEAVSHFSENCFDYSPETEKAASGSGLLGTERGRPTKRKPTRGAQSDAGPHQNAWQTTRRNGDPMENRRTGLARPSNVIEAKVESSQGEHTAPFPVALAEFFIKAFSDPGDVVFDPFLGCGTSLIAAMKHGRSGFGCEISPMYCDVIVERAQKFSGAMFQRDRDGQSFDALKNLLEPIGAPQ